MKFNEFNILSALAISLGVLCVMQSAQAVEIKGGDNPVNINGQIQVHSIVESVDDPWKDNQRLFLFLRQARLSVDGKFKSVDYEVEWMMGGEEVPERNSVMSLLDAYMKTPVLDNALELKVGQFKVPYGRERLLDSGDAFNVNRSLGNNYFNIGRDVGFAISKEQGLFSGALGVFTGGGINIPERYIPEDIGVPMFVTRFGINDGLDENVYTPAGFDGAQGRSGFAAYVNVMYNEDSRVGHSTPLNVKYFDKSLMLNSDWNPYISAQGVKSEFYQASGDLAWQFGLTETASLLLSGEGHLSTFDNSKGEITTAGGNVGANVILDGMSFGVRYGLVDPDPEMVFTDEESGEAFSITDELIHEVTGSIVYTLPDYAVKLIAELTYQIDVPVSLEEDHGVYNLMRQPDQVSYAADGGIELQDNLLANLIVQFNF